MFHVFLSSRNNYVSPAREPRRQRGRERHPSDAVRQAGAVEELDYLDLQVLAPGNGAN